MKPHFIFLLILGLIVGISTWAAGGDAGSGGQPPSLQSTATSPGDASCTQDGCQTAYDRLCRSSESAAKLFDVIDRRGTGRLTRADLDAFADKLMSADTGKKGYITREDVMAAANRSLRNRMICALLYLYDADGNGEVSTAELGRDSARFTPLDVDRNSVISGRDFELIGQASCMCTSAQLNPGRPRSYTPSADIFSSPTFTIVRTAAHAGATTPRPGVSSRSVGAITPTPGVSTFSAAVTTPAAGATTATPGVVPSPTPNTPTPGIITPGANPAPGISTSEGTGIGVIPDAGTIPGGVTGFTPGVIAGGVPGFTPGVMPQVIPGNNSAGTGIGVDNPNTTGNSGTPGVTITAGTTASQSGATVSQQVIGNLQEQAISGAGGTVAGRGAASAARSAVNPPDEFPGDEGELSTFSPPAIDMQALAAIARQEQHKQAGAATAARQAQQGAITAPGAATPGF